MNYQEFLVTVKEDFASRLSEGSTVNIQQIVKNNGVIYDALVTATPSVNMVPTIYLNPYFMKYMNNEMDLTQICDKVWQVYESHMPKADFDISVFLDFEKAKEHIVFRLINKEKNKELLSDLPHRDYLGDLAMVYYCLLDSNETGQGSILIHNNHMECWHCDEEVLYHLAMENAPLLLPVKFFNMFDALGDMLPPDLEAEDLAIIPMHVLSNRERTNGAGVMAYPGVLDQICERLQSDLVILPSSIHELILMPFDGDPNYDNFKSLIAQVNCTQLREDEVLSDHPYYYKYQTGFLEICA